MKFINDKEKRNYYVVVGVLNKLDRNAGWGLSPNHYEMYVSVDGVGQFKFDLEQPKPKQRLLNIINK